MEVTLRANQTIPLQKIVMKNFNKLLKQFKEFYYFENVKIKV